MQRWCVRCAPAGELIFDVEVVSPYGTAHLGGGEGDTLCGIDATGGKWWWRF